MADRSVSVRLRAEVNEFKRALGEGVKTLEETASAAKKTSSAVDKARSDMATASKRAEAAEKALDRAQKSTTKTAAQKESADRRLKTALDAQKKANEQLAVAEQKHKKALDDVARAQKTAETSTGRLTQSLKTNEKAWRTTGGVLAAAGATTTALAVSVVKTGVAYNSLQQTSRAALRTMLGSTEAVNAQMAKLDEFARTSPFSKQTFITAQQQMLAFGIETRKVIPYLSAINDATAAAGRSSQQLGELAFVMAQISAAGKITGQDLIQFGQRGVNAAELIGSQMGKTGAQIRADITAGTLGANEALDALAAGMSQTFAGASANVKDTFEGATDRVKAAWRDLASTLSEPLVGSDGGGAFVDLLNTAADLLRLFQQLPREVQQVVGGLVALTGVLATGAGGFLLMGTRVMENVDALRALWSGSGRASAAVRGVGIAAGVATAALAVAAVGLMVWANHIAEAKARTDEYLGTLDELGNRTEGTMRKINEVLAADTNSWLSSLFGQDPRSLIDWAEKYGLAIEDLQGYILGVEDAQVRVNSALEEYRGQFDGREQRRATEGTNMFRDALNEQAGALTNAEKQAGQKALADERAGVAAEIAAEQTEAAAEAAKIAEDAYADWWRTVESGAAAFVDVVDAYDAVIQANIDLAKEAADATKSTKDSWEDFYDGTSVTAKEWIGSLEEQVAAQRVWADNLVAAATKVREEMPPELQEAGQALVDELAAKGPEGADALASFVEMGPKQRQKIVALTKETAELAGGELQDALDVARNPVLGMDIDVANAQVDLDNFIIDASNRKIYIDIHGRQVGFGTSGSTIGRASGGAVSGPGTATSDSIPALLSDGEHVLTAREVEAMGGHGAVYRLRGLARAGLARFAKGGAVGSADREVESAKKAKATAQTKVKGERADVRNAEREGAKAVREAQRAYDRIDGKKENQAAKRAAKRDLDAARTAAKRALDAEKQQLKSAEKALREAEKALKDAQAKKSRLKDERADLRTDIRRGTIVDQVTGSRSGALSVVDRARDLASSGDLTKKQSAALNKAAKQAEKALEKQYAALDKINEKIAKQRDLVQEVGAMQARVASQIMGEVGLGQLGATEDEYGRQSGVTAGSVRAHIAGKLAKIRTFNSKLDALRKRGAPNLLLQEVLGAGIEGGTELANALLSASASDWTAITRDWKAIEAEAQRTGDIATLSEYGTTTAAAQALLDQYEKSAEKIEAQIEKQANKLIAALQKALSGGVKKAGGGWVYGPGTPTSDSVHLQASRGEFVVNAASAVANAGLLEAINSARGPVSAVGNTVPATVVDLSGLSVEVSLTTDRKFAGAIWRMGGQEVARTDRAVVNAIVGG